MICSCFYAFYHRQKIAIGYLSSSSSNPFTGILDGNGYTISGFSAKGASGVAHLIHTNQGTVKNLTISGTSSRGGVFCRLLKM